jgi:hypothetical protein
VPSSSDPKSRARTIAGCESPASARASSWNHHASSGRTLVPGRDQQLERDALVGHEIAAQIDDAHAAVPQLTADLITTGKDCPGLEAVLGHGGR